MALDARVAADEPPPRREPSVPVRLLGQAVASCVGVASSSATRTPRHVEYFARRGFDVLTYKTVRSRAWEGNDGPLWVHLDDLDRPLGLDEAAEPPARRRAAHGSPDTQVAGRTAFSDANSLGVPSAAPSVWQAELAHALTLIGPDQVLVASVQGSPEACADERELVEDFVKVARLAGETGVTAIELNLSCPNAASRAGGGVAPPLCESAPLVGRIVAAVRDGLDDRVRLVAKLAFLPPERLAPVLSPILEHCDAVAGINTLPTRVLDADGQAVFRGTTVREVAGVSGVALRDLSRAFVRSVVELRGTHDLEILAIGGVMGPDDAFALLAAGASAVQSVTAAAANPHLAAEITRALGARVTA